MLRPKSIVIVGASGDRSKISYKPISNLRDIGFEGEVFLVNPKYEEIDGYPCYPNIDSIPDNIDVALVAVGSKYVEEVLHQLKKKNIKSVALFSSGYSETGEKGQELEDRIAEFSNENSIPICGPNSLGFANVKDKTIVSFSTLEIGDYDPVAFITQSGALGSLSYTSAKELGLGFQYFVSSGNETSVDYFDYVKFMAQQDDIRVIGGYLEGARNFEKMSSAIDLCHQNNKPLVLMKVGNSSKGAEAASSHTASLAGDSNIYRNYFEQKNVVQVSDEDELIDTMSVFNKTKKSPQRGGLAVVTQSGGAGIIIADQSEIKDVQLAEINESTKEKLHEVLPPHSTLKNPIDFTAQVSQNPQQIVDSTKITLEDPNVESVILYLQMTDERFLPIIPELSKVAEETDKTLVLCWSGIKPETKEKILAQKNICWIPNPTRAINAVANVMKFYEKQEQQLDEVSYLVDHDNLTEKKDLKELDEHQSKELLRSYQIPIPNNFSINHFEELTDQFVNYPIVMKALHSEIQHKSDYGLVEININNHAEAQEAYEKIISNWEKHFPEHQNKEVLVEEMADEGVEVFVGCVNDEVFGPCIMFGLGGIFVEVLKDTAILPAPLTYNQASKMIRSIKSFPILDGERTGIQYDLKALTEVIVKISEFCAIHSTEISELDLNPVIVHEQGKGLIFVDALIVDKERDLEKVNQ